MLTQQHELKLSSYSDLYDLIVPKDNLLRKINDLIDFSFIYDELVNKYCSNNGRNAESPIRMFKYLLLKTIYDISDVDVVERSCFDMSFKYFLEMTPEEAVINPSSLTKFRKLRLKDTDLLNLLIGKTVSIAIEKGLIKSNSIIVDATHSVSRSNPLSPIEVLRERSKQLRKVIYSTDENWKERMPKKNEDNNLENEISYCHKLKKEIESGHKVVLFGYSAGSFVTYEYLSTRLPYINVLDFFNKTNIPQEEKDFVAQHPMKDTCMVAFGSSKLAVMSSTGHVVPNANSEVFKNNYLKLNDYTDAVCAPPDSIKGIVNFASPLVLFYSDLSDPSFELTYYNKLLYKYIIEKDLFWLTVNYSEDPLGFPTTRNLTIEELENYTQIGIEPHAGFIYDWSGTPSGRTFLGAHTAYWSTKKKFSKAVVNAYDNGYRHQYDKEFQTRALRNYAKKFPVPKFTIPAALQKTP